MKAYNIYSYLKTLHIASGKVAVMLILFLVLHQGVTAQKTLITYSAGNKLFTEVLSELSDRYGLKFAFDAEAFRDAHVSFEVKNQTINELVKMLSEKYPVRFRLVDGTWMVIRRQEEAKAPEPPPPPVVKIETPVIRNAVSGYVTDARTGEPLAYCNVITSTQQGTITNPLGYFRMETAGEEVQVYISHLGYQRLDTTLRIRDTGPATIRLQPFVIVMEEVSVSRKEKNMLELGRFSDKIAFNPSQSASIPRVVNDDLVNMLSMIPGVSFLNGSGGGLSIRGGDPSENLVLLDGIPLLETGHLLGNISLLNASFVRQAFVSRGGFDASAGDRSAGLIELTGRSGPLSHPTLDVSANLMNSNMVVNLPLAKKFSLTGAWRRSYLEQWQNHLSLHLLKESRISSSQEYGLNVFPAMWYDDINLKASLFPSDNQMITVGFLQGKDFQYLDYEVGEKQLIYRNEMADALNRGYSATWSLQLPKWNHSLTAGYSEISQVRGYESGRQVIVNPGNTKPKKNPKAQSKANPNPNANTSNRNKYELDRDSNLVRELRADWKSELKTGIFTHQAGVGFVDNDFSYLYFAERSQGNDPVDSLSRSLRQTIGHMFVQQYIEPVPSLKIRLGARLNYNLDLKEFYIQPRGGIEYNPTENFKAYYHSGVYRQFLSRIPKIDNYGNVDMVWFLPDSTGQGLIRSIHHVLGTQFEWGGLLVNAEVYARNTAGRQWLYAETYRKGSVSRLQYLFRQGEQKNRGIDLFLQYRHGGFTHQAAWSMAASRERMEGFNNGAYFPSLNHNRHQLSVNEIFTYKGWVLSASWTYRSGQPRITSSTADAVSFERLDYFSQLDAGLVKTFRFGKFAASGGASLLNILNRTNIVEVDHMNLSTESGNFDLFTNMSSIPFTPVFFVRLQIL